jgi:hypothetical protein
VQRIGAIVLVLCFVALGSGLMQHLHNLEHAREDAAAEADARAAGAPAPEHHDHNDSNCSVHAQLHMPLAAAGWTPVLICIGSFVAFLSLLEPPLASQRWAAPIHCRGPPVAWS